MHWLIMFCLFQNGKGDRDSSVALLVIVPGAVRRHLAGSVVLEGGIGQC